MVVQRGLRKMLLFSILVLSFSLLYARKPHWQDMAHWENPNLLDFSENREQPKNLEDFDCSGSDGQCDVIDKENKEHIKLFDANEIPFKRRSSTGLTSTTNFDKLLQMDGKTGIIPYFHTSQPLPCSCGSHYKLLDLGYAYFPRYLPTAVCSTDSCAGGTFRCRQRLYRVRVLRRRDANSPEPDSNSPQLPESLRKAWVFESFTVTVACECGP